VRAEVVDLEEVALSAFRRHESAARSFGVGLEVLAEPGATATGDSDRVLQALSNLVENALRSTPRGGSVRIVARPGRLEVVDDGPGLGADDLDRAFERFYLYDRYAGERRVGTGLGLAIVRELAEAMGGSTEVRSEPGAGATFSLVLPRPRSVGPAPEHDDRPAFVRVARTLGP
jgi:signal transduction histidine kinase